ncbi:MAG: sigma-54-dependent Fis family transcriptional regulator [Flammeovirgaceae bacterium TMED32]|nr:MAG: sigma-54-dependent Fis family transcriptional regulator [Flammeovirgaceae bacterium TMED32]
MDYREEAEVQNIKQRFGIIGISPKINNAIRTAIQVAPTDMSVLISGESGVGKESFSKIIHSLSRRKHGQFIAVNCGAIPEGTIDSELFGHEKGAFTGAVDNRKGYFESTNGGTIFLDEIGEMPLGTQARLLRVLENGEFIKVGSSKVLKTEVRVIAASNVNLEDAVAQNKFREDLYYRLNTVPIQVPALRERGKDILLLFRKFSADFSEKYRNKEALLDPDAQELIVKQPFPGNIRQLKNLVEQMSVLEIDRHISAVTLTGYLPKIKPNLPALIRSKHHNSDDLSERDILYKIMFEMKRDVSEMKTLILQVLQGKANREDLLERHESLFEDIPQYSSDQNNKLLKKATPKIMAPKDQNIESYEEVTEDIALEFENDDSLSLDKKEREMILQALKKNKNKRKYAAQDLGISERTLYRKIKNYEIDSL